ncbi:molecular chaperone GrpE [Erysipelothrix larvae]|uniref:Protein GrpE n=1 Tax=Erysipelothrix larvae TaxID=1514105 RepID=A0A0X8H061_9FIRM|nr:nucleotide exchange factor GrpE [Erysipelothrix larvae]AMC93449.1 molecular chaperone GrpE [Erysipelothrix larvae]
MSKNKKKAEEKELKKNDEATLDPIVEALMKENEELKTALEVSKNDYLKVFADADNMKKRLERDYDLSMKYRVQTFAHSILPAIDNLERALNQEVVEGQSYRDGVKMIYDQILEALKQEGVVQIDALNKPFDPNIHQALVAEAVEGVEPNTVVEEFQRGYMIKDRVLRASLVKVSE